MPVTALSVNGYTLKDLDASALEKVLQEHEQEEHALAELEGVSPTATRVAQVELFQKTRLRLADLGLAFSEHLFEDWRISKGFKPLKLNQN